MPEPAPLLALSAMRKSFPGVLANCDVDLCIRSGEIHALLGENGAGKSTLVQMIYGVLRPDGGEIRWRGTKVSIRDPARARAIGIALVFQHFSLFDSLSVLENIALGLPRATNHDQLRARIGELSTQYGLVLDADRHIYTLSVGERQRVEIIRCLLQKPKLLIMDEPTSVLTPQEVTRLFATLRQLADEGLAILYISHKLDEIKALCRRATILRGGRVVDSVEVADESASSLAAKMIGAELAEPMLRAANADDGVATIAFEVAQLTRAPNSPFEVALTNIDFNVRAGEIIGIAGVAGNGQDELLAALSGETPHADNDAIRIGGVACAALSPNPRRKLGLATIPAQRLGHAAVGEMNLCDNAMLTAFVRLRLGVRGWIRARRCRRFAADIIARFGVKAGGVDARASSLSGGNLQKFIVGREICQSPQVLIVAQPTWGVDAGAAQIVHRALRALAEQGAGVVVISQDLDELMKLSDRIAAICAGRLSPPHPTDTITTEQIGLLMAGADPCA